VLAGIGLLILGFGPGCIGNDGTSARNVILISIDTLRADMLGCYGYGRPSSPHLDAFAREGTLFETALTTAPWTLPAHGSLLTGLYPNRHGLRSLTRALRDETITWAERLAEAGFVTAAFVNSLYLTDRHGLHRGFDLLSYAVEVELRMHASEVEGLALEWLSHAPRQPFFLFLHFYDVHADYGAEPRYVELFSRPYAGPLDGSARQLREVRAGRARIGAEGARHLIDLYVAGIRQMDDGLGRLFDAIDRAGLRDDTLVVVTSDHGEEFLEHGGVLHGGTQFDEVLRIPLILRGPGVPAGTRLAEPVSVVDVLPTVLAQLGLPPAPDLDGRDLSPLWSDTPPAALRDRPIFSEADLVDDPNGMKHSDQWEAVRKGHFKLIRDRRSGSARLYDVGTDPGESRNRSARHRATRRRLEGHLQRHRDAQIPGTEIPPPGPEVIERLRALGYF
jgi:arylsulfatase A-like enzyme